MQKSDHRVLKGIIWLQNDKIGSNGFKGVNRAPNDKMRSIGVQRSQLGTQ